MAEKMVAENEENKATLPKTDLILMSSTKKLNLQRPINKVLGFCPMFNNTSVLLAKTGENEESVIHINQ